ncbi:PREDICTED: vomeronasal type-1 receptor 4-like [Chinchilla lanigera]|uniref:vomeronasal type-1 receptor 4-like n=1 Tax=Chinchilla lanigera TaxID=34839 RepID=UPI00038F0D4D|nr:PREDICTED: vomeronasal type-1 receptor 4-like [Chinchilla lanigera]
MIPEHLVMGIFFFSQTTVGILGNWSLLFHYFFSVYTGKNLTPTDQIITHLTFANSLAIMSRGIPQTMRQFGSKYLLDDTGCKLTLYLNRISRGISLNTTCLLSCFQALTISPRSGKWVAWKHRTTKYISPCCSLGWLIHLLLNIMITMRVTGYPNSENFTNRFHYGFCSGFVSGTITTPLYVSLLCCTDGLCLGLMAWASGSMVSILYGHKRQVRYIHSAHRSPRVSPEARATQTILLLVCTFVTCYSLSSTLVVYVTFFENPRLWVINIFAFLETCFPMFCPFVLINNNSTSRSYFSCWGSR